MLIRMKHIKKTNEREKIYNMYHPNEHSWYFIVYKATTRDLLWLP